MIDNGRSGTEGSSWYSVKRSAQALISKLDALTDLSLQECAIQKILVRWSLRYTEKPGVPIFLRP